MLIEYDKKIGWYVDREGDIRMRDAVPDKKGPNRTAVDIEWGAYVPDRFSHKTWVGRWDLERRDYSKNMADGWSLYTFYEWDIRRNFDAHFQAMKNYGDVPFPDFERLVPIVLEAYRQSRDIDHSILGGGFPPPRVQLVRLDGSTISVPKS